MLVAYTNEDRWEVRTLIEDYNCLYSIEIKACTSRFLSNHIIKSLATNLDIPVTAVQDQMHKKFDVGVSKMKAFRAKRIATGPWPGQILTAVGVDANNEIYPVAHAIVEAKTKATYVGEFNKKIAELKSFNYAAYDWLMKIPAEQWSITHFSGRTKCDLLLNHICEVFNRQLVDGRDQPIITCLEYIIEYLMKRILVAQKATKKRKKSHDEIANESCSSGKLSRKGKSARCGKCGNKGHNRKGCKGQGGATQASARQAAGARIVSGQVGGASNVSTQSGGSSQPITAQSTSTGARNAPSQPSAAPSTTSQRPTQHGAGPRQGFQAPRPGFPTQRLTKTIASKHNPRKLSS
nr:transposase, mutator type [Tanacetum cinerariifolium]